MLFNYQALENRTNVLDTCTDTVIASVEAERNNLRTALPAR
jgi:hypothetical protein